MSCLRSFPDVRIITKADGIYEGTCQLVDASVHVNGSYEKTERTWDTVEVLVDELSLIHI